ncbi:MAG: sulfatase [Planctomycetota bacterium]
MAGAPAEPPFNVIVLVADDLGWTDLGCQGSSFYETPNIDRLASEGMRFTQAYAACCVCSPTRAALLTGKSPARMDTTDYFGGRRKAQLLPAPYDEELPAADTTLAEALRAADYRTAFFGKWHLGGPGSYPEDHGFETNVGGFERGHPPRGYFSPYGNPKLPDGPQGELLTERLTDEAVAWMKSVRDEPFLLYLSYYAVHTPLQTRPEYQQKYEAKREAQREAKRETQREAKRETQPLFDESAWGEERARKVRLVQDHAVYAGMVQSLDESVGRVLAALAELGLDGRTLVIFASDNGGLSTSEGHPTSNLPLRAGKGWLYEGGIREPFLVRWPGVTEPGSICREPVTSQDVFPTILEALDLPLMPEQHVDGTSLAKLLRGDGTLEPRSLYWHYPHYGNQGGAPSGAIRTGRYKLIEWFEDGSTELFDLDADPGETTDLRQREPEIADRLRKELAAWRRQVEAKMPSPNPEHE